MAMKFTTQLLPSRSGNVVIIKLNNPKALHALTMDMCYSLQGILDAWKSDETLKAIWMEGSDDDEAKRPSFCAGGDVKSIYESQIASFSSPSSTSPPHTGQPGERGRMSSDFFFTEYQVNHALAVSKIPQVSIWNGIVMGGGVGLSIHGKYRIATENTLFAMPETAIGFFPDVGGMYWLPRLPRSGLGTYLALTGARLKGADVLRAGIATHYMSSSRIGDLKGALIEACQNSSENDNSHDGVAPVLMSFNEMMDTSNCFLAKHEDEIDAVFDPLKQQTVEDMVVALEERQHESEFCRSTLVTLKKVSPMSLKVTLEALKRGLHSCDTIAEDLKMEYRLSQAFMRRQSDFYEGIRAALVDKDGKPEWNPAVLEEVTDEMVQSYFEPLGENEWFPHVDEQESTAKL